MDKIFKALGDKTRLEMLILISLNPDICLCHIENYFQLSNSNLSRHLKELESNELIIGTKIGKWKHYQINHLGIEAVDLIKKMDHQFLYNNVSAKSTTLSKEPKC